MADGMDRHLRGEPWRSLTVGATTTALGHLLRGEPARALIVAAATRPAVDRLALADRPRAAAGLTDRSRAAAGLSERPAGALALTDA